MLSSVSSVFAFERLPFETERFGRPVSRLVLRGALGADSGPALKEEMAVRRRGGEYLVNCRLPEDLADDADAALRGAGFVPVETLITFERAIDVPLAPPPPAIAPAGPADIEPCVAIGARAFVYDRFHADARLPKDRADALKGAWVRNDLTARADACFVARRDGTPAGFVLCLKQDELAIIDLIAVGPEHQRRGLGRALMLAAIARYAGPRRRMRVGTQESNGASVKLYHSLGFAQAGRARTYHWVAA